MTALYIGIATHTVVNRGIVLTDDECERRYLATCSDTLDHTTDERADGRNFGFEAGAFHALPNTHERQHEHG